VAVRTSVYYQEKSQNYDFLLNMHHTKIHFKEDVYSICYWLQVMSKCEIWSITFREEHILRVFENRVLREIFGLKE
jgi:hypothetical protein